MLCRMLLTDALLMLGDTFASIVSTQGEKQKKFPAELACKHEFAFAELQVLKALGASTTDQRLLCASCMRSRATGFVWWCG